MLALSNEMLILLRGCLAEHRPDLLYVVDRSELLKVDEALSNQLRDAVLDEFVINGLNPDSEPNALGIRLEELIDQIGRFFL
jgi:hypothetical protein